MLTGYTLKPIKLFYLPGRCPIPVSVMSVNKFSNSGTTSTKSNVNFSSEHKNITMKCKHIGVRTNKGNNLEFVEIIFVRYHEVRNEE